MISALWAGFKLFLGSRTTKIVGMIVAGAGIFFYLFNWYNTQIEDARQAARDEIIIELNSTTIEDYERQLDANQEELEELEADLAQVLKCSGLSEHEAPGVFFFGAQNSTIDEETQDASGTREVVQ